MKPWLALLALLWTVPAAAISSYLIKDINPKSSPASLQPRVVPDPGGRRPVRGRRRRARPGALAQRPQRGRDLLAGRHLPGKMLQRSLLPGRHRHPRLLLRQGRGPAPGALGDRRHAARHLQAHGRARARVRPVPHRGGSRRRPLLRHPAGALAHGRHTAQHPGRGGLARGRRRQCAGADGGRRRRLLPRRRRGERAGAVEERRHAGWHGQGRGGRAAVPARGGRPALLLRHGRRRHGALAERRHGGRHGAGGRAARPGRAGRLWIWIGASRHPRRRGARRAPLLHRRQRRRRTGAVGEPRQRDGHTAPDELRGGESLLRRSGEPVPEVPAPPRVGGREARLPGQRPARGRALGQGPQRSRRGSRQRSRHVPAARRL